MKSPNASQYLPPQDPHYTYSSSAQVLDAQPARVPYPPDAAFPKLENINEVLQAQQAQQALHANHALHPPPLAQQQQQQQAQQQQQQQLTSPPPKPNRLRKACDSCSIRKVKVRDTVYLGPGRPRACHC